MRPGERRPARRPRSRPARTSPETWSASRWIGARLRWASATSCTICDSIVSRPTFWRLDHERAALVHGAADDLGADLLRYRHRLAGDHRLVDGAAALETTPSTGTFSPGRTRRRSPTCTASSWTSSSRRRADAPRRLGREVEQRPDGAARALARPQLEHLPEQDEQDGDDGRRLEVDGDRAVMAAERRREDARREVATTL